MMNNTLMVVRKDDLSVSHHEDIHDVLKVMREKEETIYPRNFVPNELEALWRKILIDWMMFVVDHCNLQRQAVAAAAYFLDTAMSRGLIETREEHQLAAASSLQLALKLFDSTVIRIEKLVNLGRGLFTKEDLAVMEYKIVTSLKWNCHPPSTYCFLRQYERLLPTTVPESTRRMIDEVTKVVVELTIPDHKYNKYPCSIIAYASMLMAMELMSFEDFPVGDRQCFVLHMSTVSKLESNSPQTLAVFEELKESLDSSTQLESLLESLRKVRGDTTGRTSEDKRHKSSSPSAKLQSPRDVMGRIGCLSNNSSLSSLQEIP